MADEGIISLPTSEAEMDEMLAVIAANGGTEVSEEDAAAHMLTSLLGGKIFYAVGQEVSDATDIWGGKATFNADLTEITFVEAYGSNAGATEIMALSIDGNRIIFGSDTDGSYTIVGENKGDYIEFNDYHSDGTIESHTRLYFDKTKADAYVATLAGGSSTEQPFSFTTDYLNGKSFYYVQHDDFGYDVMKWNMARMDFTVNTFNWTEYDTADTGTHTMTYAVNSEGNIIFDYGDGNQHVISSSEITNDYIKVCQDGDCNTYLFFDETKAKTFRDSQNGAQESLAITEAMLSGKTFYTVSEYDGDVSLIEYGEISFISSTEVSFKERLDYDGTASGYNHIFPYTLENGAIVIDDSFPEDPSTLVYELESMTDTQWNLFKDRESIVYTHWLLTKPANFPSL